MYEIDRKSAAKQLKVSIRTVDRYINAKKLSFEKRDGRIWLEKREVVALKRRMAVDNVDNVDTADLSPVSIDKSVSTDDDMSIDNVHFMSTVKRTKSVSQKPLSSEEVYKKLYEELREEYRRQQERLEGANYRVGQLEAFTRESVPLIDHQKLLSEEKAMRFELEESIEQVKENLDETKKALNEISLSRRIAIIALFILLLLQPFIIFFLSR